MNCTEMLRRVRNREMGLPPIAGGAGPLQTLVTNTVGLTTTPATIATLGPPIKPGSNAYVYIPQVTAVATGASVVIAILRGDTNTVIGSGTFTNNGAGAGAIGPINVSAPVPANIAPGASLYVQGNTSSGTGTCQGSATAPIMFNEDDVAYSS